MIEPRQGLTIEPVQIRHRTDQSLMHQLRHEFPAKPFDIHCISTGKISDSFSDLRGTVNVGTTDVDAAFIFDKLRLAFGALLRKIKRL